MESLGITAFDILVIVILALSALYGMGRGFVSEILSLVAWIGAAFVTIYGFPHVRPWARQYMEPEAFADTIAIVVLGVVSLIVLKFLAHFLGKLVKQSDLGFIDRSFGALFGLLRGLFVVCVVFLMINWLVPKQSFPDWIAGARTLPLVEFGAELLSKVTPAEIVESLSNLDNGGLDTMLKNAVKEHAPGVLDDKSSSDE
ncbi:MAG: CvpA family protein [Sphingomonadales bacterium]|nr:CvpA family protein [Sphingomonadales bacterium]